MLDKDHCESVKGKFTLLKSTVEREAREAYAAGLKPNDACPYPFHSTCGLHWLAHYNLCIPLPSKSPMASAPCPLPMNNGS